MKLEGKVALVTGSGRNIGRATILKLAAEGANVVVNARTNRQEADSVAAEARALGVETLSILADVADRHQVASMVAQTMERFGKIDILINNAAVRPHKPFTEVTLEDWEEVRGVVLDGAFYCTHAVIPSMVENQYGRILFFTGDGAFQGGAQRAHVSAAKMGLVGLARSLASEFAPQNIRVNVVSPGSIDTTREHPEWYPQQQVPNASRIPLGRQGTVDEIAATCLFLVSDDGGFITGQSIHVQRRHRLLLTVRSPGAMSASSLTLRVAFLEGSDRNQSIHHNYLEIALAGVDLAPIPSYQVPILGAIVRNGLHSPVREQMTHSSSQCAQSSLIRRMTV